MGDIDDLLWTFFSKPYVELHTQEEKLAYQAHAEKWMAYCRQLAGQDDWDLYHDALTVFITMIRKKKFNPNGKASISTFLYIVIKCTWIDRWRKDRREDRKKKAYMDSIQSQGNSKSQQVADPADIAEASELIYKIWEKFGEEQKLKILLEHIDETSFRKLGIRYGQNKDKIWLEIQKFKEEIKNALE